MDKVKKQALAVLFYYLLFLTGFFILFEISFFILCHHAYLNVFQFVSHKLTIPLAIVPGILGFIAAQLAVHLGYCILIWIITYSFVYGLGLSAQRVFNVGISLFILGIVTILIANCYLYPNAKFSELVRIVLSPMAGKALFYLLSGSCLILIILAMAGLFISKRWPMIVASLLFSSFYLFPENNISYNVASKERPNIIIIGIDSLRPDFLSYSGYHVQTKFLDSLLKESTIFTQAYTPLARTFPSWTSILTGEYPYQNGVRTNLASQQHLSFSQSLASILRGKGYEAIYASDETRFSNIGKNYGFDRIVTPPIGLNDFLLGTFNDFPISNLLVNTKLGAWLFPYSYANRAAYSTYDPDDFIDLLKPAILTNHKNPLFLAIHFCLPHHPYLWKQLSGVNYQDIERYEQSIQRVDQQLADFFALLKQAKLLDHAIVVILSDHGEALELPGDRITAKTSYVGEQKKQPPRFYPPSADNEEFNQSAGHGGDVLGLSQYHTLLAFKLYGFDQKYAEVAGRVSLTQIKPTLLAFLSTDKEMQGSLSTYILGAKKHVADQHIFLESDFSPESIRTVHPETKKVIFEGVELFAIDPNTTRLIVRDDMTKMIIESKQYADIYGDWMLAVYPQKDNRVIPILINLKTGLWTDNLASTFAIQSPFKKMLNELHRLYGINTHQVLQYNSNSLHTGS